ncbi:hypothetical protein [Myroides sp. N17-2]|uniref:hypothetical protein n=1 Tax=Myroides sp. N17-2 TaxID=2030799 RepID=UPI000EFCE14C|nr:hypothetical protein [Myroides sp. N17-2]
MIGFTGKIKLVHSVVENEEFSVSTFKNVNIEITRTSNGKFLKDKVFFEREGFLFLIEGVITNTSELIKKYQCSNWEEVFYASFQSNKKSFFNEFRGSFCGLVYDLNTNHLVLFVDQLRTKDIYYSKDEEHFYFSTDIAKLVEVEKGKYVLDIDAAYLLLTFGATLEERTLFSSIRKLPYGSSLQVLDSTLTIESYYKIDIDYSGSNKKSNLEHIEQIDKLFRQAIDRQFSKDVEYGYNHLVGLSAGRDSRMTTWVSNKMGYNQDVMSFTFSESDQLDEMVPKQIARDLNIEWVFKALDNGNCFKFFEKVNEVLCGELSLQNVLHGYSFLKNFNFSNYGMIHSGQVGDGVINYYGNVSVSNSLMQIPYVQSKMLMNRVIERNIVSLSDYKSDEEFVHVNRGIGVTLGSAQFIYQFTETFSPFTDIDLMNYCFTVPYDIRKGLKLYDDWMINKYPESTKYSHNGRKIGGKEITFMGKSSTLGELPEKIIRTAKNTFFNSSKGLALTGMNPMDRWYLENSSLRSKIDNYYDENINLVTDDILKSDVEILFKNGNVGDKMQVITLLTTLKQYF